MATDDIAREKVVPWDRIQNKGKVKSEFIFHTLCRYRACSILY
jgi:hypothetical protein